MKAEVYLHLEESQMIPSGKSSRDYKSNFLSFQKHENPLAAELSKINNVAAFEDWTKGKEVWDALSFATSCYDLQTQYQQNGIPSEVKVPISVLLFAYKRITLLRTVEQY